MVANPQWESLVHQVARILPPKRGSELCAVHLSHLVTQMNRTSEVWPTETHDGPGLGRSMADGKQDQPAQERSPIRGHCSTSSGSSVLTRYAAERSGTSHSSRPSRRQPVASASAGRVASAR